MPQPRAAHHPGNLTVNMSCAAVTTHTCAFYGCPSNMGPVFCNQTTFTCGCNPGYCTSDGYTCEETVETLAARLQAEAAALRVKNNRTRTAAVAILSFD